ncbi:alpha-protein kinase 2 [Synchiropus picturatus]
MSEYSEACVKSTELFSKTSKYHSKEKQSECCSPPPCSSLCHSMTESKDSSGSCDTSEPSQMPLDFIPNSTVILPERVLEPEFVPLKEVMESNDNQCHTSSLLLSHQADSSECDSAVEPMTELYIYESETQDFILRPSVDPLEIDCPEYLSLVGMKGESELYCNTESLADSPASQGHDDRSEKTAVLGCESPLSRYKALSTADEGTWESGSKSESVAKPEGGELTSQVRESDSQVELWLDACQYLADDEPEKRDLLEPMKLPVAQEEPADNEDLFFPQEQEQESSYVPDCSDRIGWSVHDRGRGPPVQRWSSVDSWATALSDWTGIISAQPEEITATFTEIGAELDALTQALADVDVNKGGGAEGANMGVQDQPQNMPQNPILSFDLVAPGGEQTDRESIQTLESLCGSIIAAREQIVSELRPSVCLSGGREPSTTELNFSHLRQYEETSVRDIQSSKEEIILQIIEDTEAQEGEQSQASGVEVNHISEPTPANEAETPSDVLPTLTVSHVCGVDAESRQTHVPASTLDRACQVEPKWGGLEFMMPSAPLRISSSHWPSSSLDGDQICDRGCEEKLCNGNTSQVEDNKDLRDIKKEDCSSDKLLNSLTFSPKKTLIEEISDFSRDLSNLIPVSEERLKISEENRVAVFTLDINDPFASRIAKQGSREPEKVGLNNKISERMPNKSHKKEKSVPHPAARKQENLTPGLPQQQISKQKENVTGENQKIKTELEDRNNTPQGEAEFETVKPHSKKKKKHGQHAGGVKLTTGSQSDVEITATQKTAKGRIDMFEAKISPTDKETSEKKQQDGKHSHKEHKEQKPKTNGCPPSEDVVKRRRLSEDKFGKIVGALESKLGKLGAPAHDRKELSKTDAGATRKKTFSEVVKQKPVTPKEEPKVLQPIQVLPVSGDPQSLCLWCQFTTVFTQHTVTWRRDGVTLAEVDRSAGDESRVSLTISNASHKDLGKYQCCLQSSHGSVTLDYLLTYEVLSEVVIPLSPTTISIAPVEVECEEEDVRCSKLMFKEDFLTQQFFGEDHGVSILTEKVHFGEGMHRQAFRTKLQTSQAPQLLPGHSCVLKVHNAISYGTKSSEELIQRNFTLAVEECQVQNTAREFIKAYTAEAQGCEAFGKVPEIIPIFLVHRPSNDIPYATLEEELIGDFVKYSVKDGKEINLLRRDSEAGRKCCAFQHWVYAKTDGNLLVTDMQGVGMRLTDVGIATCKKGYKGFKGNCSTSFIDQFKALHQCNTYCEILGLKSLQPKPKKAASAPKAKPQPSAIPKKKMFGPTVKGKS